MSTSEKDPAKKLEKKPPDENFAIRCPRLGHQVNFTYCRIENSGLPCFKTLDCWFNHFDVHGYLSDEMSKEDFEKAFLNKGKPKVLSLMDLIEQAKKNKDKTS